ncbi:MAG: TRAP transporter substrate-binding protein [Candidatus Saganbacteria bacterium]|nr:TRAP transporter substrate-binding protein [Candidatus Saganbacteria bacterium]
MQRILVLIFLAVVVLSVVSVFIGGCNPTSSVTVILTAGHNTDPEFYYQKGLEYFAKKVEEKTKGQVKVQIFSRFDINSGSDVSKAFQDNKLDMALVNSSDLGDIVPQIMVFDLPYLIKSHASAYKILDSSIGDYLSRLFLEKEIRNLAYFDNGFKNLSNQKKAITQPKDVAGLTFGTPNNPIIKMLFKRLKAKTAIVPLKEMYFEIKSKKIDGQENSVELAYYSHLFDQQPYLSMTKHAYSTALLLIKEKTFKKLSDEQKEAILEAAKEAQSQERLQSMLTEEQVLTKLKALLNNKQKQIIKIKEPNIDAFKKELLPLYEESLALIGSGNRETGKKLLDSIQQNQ